MFRTRNSCSSQTVEILKSEILLHNDEDLPEYCIVSTAELRYYTPIKE